MTYDCSYCKDTGEVVVYQPTIVESPENLVTIRCPRCSLTPSGPTVEPES